MRHRADADPGAEGDLALPDRRRVRLRVGIGAAVVLAIAALVVAVLLSAMSQQGSAVSLPTAAASSGAPAGVSSGAAAGPELMVHVLGAVRTPGLVSLAPGSRVIDAVAASGGLTDDADPGAVNLARPLADGEQLRIPKVGEAPPAASADGSGGGSGGGSGTGGGSGGSVGALINLNTATQADLETLPRIGPALAQRILDWRTANGRFTAPTDLLQITGIGEKIFDALKDKVTV